MTRTARLRSARAHGQGGTVNEIASKRRARWRIPALVAGTIVAIALASGCGSTGNGATKTPRTTTSTVVSQAADVAAAQRKLAEAEKELTSASASITLGDPAKAQVREGN